MSKRILGFFILVAIIVSSLPIMAEEPTIQNQSQAEYKPLQNSDFEEDLVNYYNMRSWGSALLWIGAIGVSSGFIGSSTSKTMQSLGYLDQSPGQIIEYSSNGTIIVTAIAGLVGFILWKVGSDGYMDTLQAQMRYENLVR